MSPRGGRDTGPRGSLGGRTCSPTSYRPISAGRTPVAPSQASLTLLALVVAATIGLTVAAVSGFSLFLPEEGLGTPSGSQGPGLLPLAPPLTARLNLSNTVGLPPLAVNLTASASGGTSPYSLELCPASTICQNFTGWSGVPITIPATFGSPGNYTVSALVADSASTQSEASGVVHVLAPRALMASVVSPVTKGVAPFADQFEAVITGGYPPYALAWDFGDGSSAMSASGVPVSHTYSSAGLYHPALTISDARNTIVRQALPAVSVSASTPSQTIEVGPVAIPYWAVGAAVALVVSLVGGGYIAYERRLRRESIELVQALWRETEVPPVESEPK